MSEQFFRIHRPKSPLIESEQFPDGYWIAALEIHEPLGGEPYFSRISYRATKAEAKVFNGPFCVRAGEIFKLMKMAIELVPASFDEWIECNKSGNPFA